MELKSLLSKVETVSVSGPEDRDITSIAYDSRRVQPGGLFIALKGEKVDGRQFIDAAIGKGAIAVVEQEGSNAPVDAKITTVRVKDARQAMADLAATFFHHPSHALKMTGITGTKGKTTVAFLVKHLCEQAFLRSGLIGTVRYEIGDKVVPAPRTTPESLDVQDLLYQMRSAGCRSAVMEVSSHALMQERVRGVEFDVAIFTNLKQDHLDYHVTMENYFEAKARLFAHIAAQPGKKKGKAVINMDDTYGARLAERVAKQIPVTTYGVSTRADFRASSFKTDFSGTTFQLDAQEKSFLVRLPLMGRFNIYNALAALASVSSMGLDLRTAVLGLANAPAVPGRMQQVPAKRKFQVFVDYAHTEDSLLNVMKTLRELSPARLIVVFGCGGNRDRAKRPLMGAAVEQNADVAIITSDNPRKEDPEAILEDVKKGFRGKSYEVFVDRKEAINHAVAIARPRDIVLIAGKGHETYQEFADRTIDFDDVAVAKAAIEAHPVEHET
jgi:UDP-N-acetylmuramoyl-L-alanyl-D-glutamate--2,6-diaminopimelate ligase